MGLITWIKEVWNKLFKREIKERFGADILLSYSSVGHDGGMDKRL